MTVRNFLKIWKSSISVQIYQRAIKEISGNDYEFILRQVGEISVLLDGNQNYLDFEIEYCTQDFGQIVVMCKANEEQEQKTIEAYKEKQKYNFMMGD